MDQIRSIVNKLAGQEIGAFQVRFQISSLSQKLVVDIDLACRKSTTTS